MEQLLCVLWIDSSTVRPLGNQMADNLGEKGDIRYTLRVYFASFLKQALTTSSPSSRDEGLFCSPISTRYSYKSNRGESD